MGIFDNVTTTPAQQAADQGRGLVRQQFRQLGMSGVQGFNLIWKNRNATPQEVIAELGTDAAVVFQLAGLNIATVTTASQIAGTTPPAIPEVPAGNTLTFNPDGSATVTTVAPAPSNASSGTVAQ